MTLYNPKNYFAQVYWGRLRVKICKFELDRATKNLKDYEDWWNRFINYCHTGK